MDFLAELRAQRERTCAAKGAAAFAAGKQVDFLAELRAYSANALAQQGKPLHLPQANRRTSRRSYARSANALA
ncbi:hypothetical protein J45TS6_41320 [Paenibacillus sp. J45TS6]|nr:hypothetical protein J45TS6_41320 [Paenibacillus sp. J45TS6]